MQQNTKIALNTVVTYSRSLLALLLGLFTSRWVLVALGQTDFGLYGVVGSLITFVTFLNIVLSGSMARFYAYSIGKDRSACEDGNSKEVTRWFNIAWTLHFSLGIVILVLGLSLGTYAVRHWLVIPADRMTACVTVLWVSLFGAFVSIAAVPYVSMYTAYQNIAELAVFEMLRVVAMFIFSYLLLGVSGDRLIWYASAMSGISSLIHIAMVVRSRQKFPVGRLRWRMMIDVSRLAGVGSFALWKFFGVLGWLFRQQGSAMLINLRFGPGANAAYSIAMQISSLASQLSSSLMTALTPAITTMEGGGKKDQARLYSIRACIFPTVLVLILAIPLICELHYVLDLWLKDPPPYTYPLGICMVATLILETMGNGLLVAITADGRIRNCQLIECAVLVMVVPVAWCGYVASLPMYTVGFVFILATIVVTIARIVICKRLFGYSPLLWIRKVLLPVLVIVPISFGAGCLLRLALDPGFMRLMLVGLFSLVSTVGISWLLVLDGRERCVVRGLILSKLPIKR